MSQFSRFILLIFFTLSACSNPLLQDDELFIFGATIVVPESGELLSNRIVHVKNKLINEILIGDESIIPENAYRIDAQGSYLIPGLADMHIHFDHPDVLKLNLAYGITSVINFRGFTHSIHMLRSN